MESTEMQLGGVVGPLLCFMGMPAPWRVDPTPESPRIKNPHSTTNFCKLKKNPEDSLLYLRKWEWLGVWRGVPRPVHGDPRPSPGWHPARRLTVSGGRFQNRRPLHRQVSIYNRFLHLWQACWKENGYIDSWSRREKMKNIFEEKSPVLTVQHTGTGCGVDSAGTWTRTPAHSAGGLCNCSDGTVSRWTAASSCNSRKWWRRRRSWAVRCAARCRRCPRTVSPPQWSGRLQCSPYLRPIRWPLYEREKRPEKTSGP